MTIRVNNFLTLDVEEWFDAEIIRNKLSSQPEQKTSLDKQIDTYLEICNSLNIRSTCFVVGKLASAKPEIIRKLHENGHEIASHSYDHKLLYQMKSADFKEDLHKSISILEGITGEKVKGYRAPSWSVNRDIVGWFYKILEEEGIVYSSSIFPAKNFLYGMPGASQIIHKVEGTNIIEIPQQIIDFSFIKTGVAGGAYMRLFPAWLIKSFINSRNKNNHPVFIYIHPWELIYQKYPVPLSPFERILQYYGIRNNKAKIENICNSIKSSFIRMDSFVIKHYLA